MHNQLINWLVKWRRQPAIRIWYRTLATLYPLVLLGGWLTIGGQSFLNPNGFLYQIVHANLWLNDQLATTLSDTVMLLSQVVLGLISVWAGIVSSYYWAQYYQRDTLLTTVTMVLVSLLVLMRFGTDDFSKDFNWQLGGITYLWWWLILAQLISWLLSRLAPPLATTSEVHVITLQQRAHQNIGPLTITLLVALVIGLGVDRLIMAGGIDWWQTMLQNWLTTEHPWYLKAIIMMGYTALQWAGLADSNQFLLLTGGYEWQSNLSAALANQPLPYPLASPGIFNSYALFGGSGCLLALLLALSLQTKHPVTRQLLRWNLIPVLFNQNTALMFGLPILFNPLFLGSMLVIPLANLGLAWITISIHWVPTPVFDAPVGTPSVLLNLAMTNGDWRSGLLALGLLVLDVCLYLPIVKLYLQGQSRLSQLDADTEIKDER